MRWCYLIAGLFLTALGSSPAAAEMSKRVARSVGSFFAAATSCEQQEKIEKGRTEALLAALDPYLSADNKRWIREGYDEGSRRSAVLVLKTGWVSFSPDEDGCFRVQGVLDDYKMQLSEP